MNRSSVKRVCDRKGMSLRSVKQVPHQWAACAACMCAEGLKLESPRCRRRRCTKRTQTIQAMAVLSKMARSRNAMEQIQNRTLAKLRHHAGIYMNIPIDSIQPSKFSQRWNEDAPRPEDFGMKNETFQNRVESELGVSLAENKANDLCLLTAAFAIHSGYLRPPNTEKLTGNPTSCEEIPIEWLAWCTIWCLYEDAGKDRVRKLIRKYKNSDATKENIRALTQDVKHAMRENSVRPQTCANHGCSHLGKTYACETCRAVFYCCKMCQKSDWLRHKSECTQYQDYRSLKQSAATKIHKPRAQTEEYETDADITLRTKRLSEMVTLAQRCSDGCPESAQERRTRITRQRPPRRTIANMPRSEKPTKR